MKSITISLDEHDCVPKFHKIANNIFFKIIDMGLNVYISFEYFFIDLNMNEENYIFALCSTLRKPTFFSNIK
jgi:hypothetical protein